MNKAMCALSGLSLLLASSFAVAGPGGVDCASAEEIFPNHEYTPNTASAGYGNPVGGLGPLPSPGNDAIYFFTSDGQATENITVTAADYNYAIFLTTNCAGTTAPPMAAATGPGTSSFPVGQLNAGTRYYVIVSSNPADASAPSGSLTFTTPNPLPVALQSFSVD